MKRHLTSFLLAATAATLLLTGCSTLYHPQSVDIPLINHQGDLRIDASASLSAIVFPDAITFGSTVSYGFNDWLAVQGHINYGCTDYYSQLAPGAYLPLSEKAVVEGYAGVGFGGSWTDEPIRVGTEHMYSIHSYKGNYTLPFVQGNIGWHDLTKAHIDLALGLKAGAFLPSYDYVKYDNNYQPIPEDSYHYSNTSFLFEPQLMFRIGSEHLKFNLRGGMTWLSDVQKGDSRDFVNDLITLSTGITFCF